MVPPKDAVSSFLQKVLTYLFPRNLGQLTRDVFVHRLFHEVPVLEPKTRGFRDRTITTLDPDLTWPIHYRMQLLDSCMYHHRCPSPPTRRTTSIDYQKKKPSVYKIWKNSIICIIYQTVNKKSSSFPPSTPHLNQSREKPSYPDTSTLLFLSLRPTPSSNEKSINHYPSSGRNRFIAPPSYPPFWPWINAGLTCPCCIPYPPRPTGIPPCFFLFLFSILKNALHCPFKFFSKMWIIGQFTSSERFRISNTSIFVLFCRIDEETMTRKETDRERQTEFSMPKCNRIAMQRRTRERQGEGATEGDHSKSRLFWQFKKNPEKMHKNRRKTIQ